MSTELISPNWHVTLIHYPIALLTLGLFIEIITLFKRKGSLRTAGRWMIGLGAFSTLPVLTSGLFAFADQVTGGMPAMGTWHEAVQQSSWYQQQWAAISHHIWFNSIASLLAVLVVMVWIASPDHRRRKLYLFCLLGLIAADVLIGLGAFHGGRLVFDSGVGVVPHNLKPPLAKHRTLDYYAPPLQVHVILAGLVVACIFAGISLMFRKWEGSRPARLGDTLETRIGVADPLARDPTRDRPVRDVSGAPVATIPPKVYPGWFLIAAAALALLTAFFGYWSYNQGYAFTYEALSDNANTLGQSDHIRLLLHVIMAACLVVLPLLLGIFVRFMRSRRMVPLVTTGLLIAAMGFQMWWGIAILYDGHVGPVFGFNPPPAPVHTKQAPAPPTAAPTAPVKAASGHGTGVHPATRP